MGKLRGVDSQRLSCCGDTHGRGRPCHLLRFASATILAIAEVTPNREHYTRSSILGQPIWACLRRSIAPADGVRDRQDALFNTLFERSPRGHDV